MNSDPPHAFWLTPGPNATPSPVETARLLLATAPWAMQVPFESGGWSWVGERVELVRGAWKWRLRQASGQNAGKVRHTSWL